MKEPVWKILPKAAMIGAIWVLVGSVCFADVVILKDGHVLEGKLRREVFLEFDQLSKESFSIPKGFYKIEDAARTVVFGQSLVRSLEQKNPPFEEFYSSPRSVYIPQPKPIKAVMGMKDIGKWTTKWDRKVEVFTPNGIANINQHLSYIGSRSVRMDSTLYYPWNVHYLTSELDKKMIDDLIAAHPEFQKKVTKGSAESFAQSVKHTQFLFQAGRLEDAIKKVNDCLSEFEANKEYSEKLEEIRKKAFEQIQSVKIRQAKALVADGYYEATVSLLGSVVENQCAQADLLDLRGAKAKSEKELDTFREIKAALAEVGEELTGSNLLIDKKMLEKFTREVTAFDNQKMEPFLSQFKQWKKQEKPKDDGKPEKLAALALTGWSLGQAAADPNIKSAKRIHELREQLKATMVDMAINRKSTELRELQKKFPEQSTVDDLTILLSSLGPISPDPAPPLFPESPTLRTFPGTFGFPAGSYLVQVPQQYDPAKAAPVIIVLKAISEKAADAMIRWREEANREGYIVAVPEWTEAATPNKYAYSVKEHDNLLACLRDLRARYRVDSDRVFLVGNLEGAQMAFDAGLSHPDLFAGVVPISGAPVLYSDKYWRNGVYLPFYVVTGDLSPMHDAVNTLFTNWATKGYNAIWVQYKGRGLDWFHGEIPLIVKWMKEKRRVFPLRALGADGNGGVFGNEFRTMRSTDNQFYWLEALDINPRNLASPPPDWDGRVSPATLFAKVEPEKNEVTIKTSGINKLNFLIHRNSKGDCCVNLDKPVTIRWNLNQLFRNQKIKIDMEMMLEDQARWQDQQKLLLGRLELSR